MSLKPFPRVPEALIRELEELYRHRDEPKPWATGVRRLDFEAGQRNVVRFLRRKHDQQQRREGHK